MRVQFWEMVFTTVQIALDIVSCDFLVAVQFYFRNCTLIHVTTYTNTESICKGNHMDEIEKWWHGKQENQMRWSRVLFGQLQVQFFPKLHSHPCDYLLIITTYLQLARTVTTTIPPTFSSKPVQFQITAQLKKAWFWCMGFLKYQLIVIWLVRKLNQLWRHLPIKIIEECWSPHYEVSSSRCGALKN